MLLTPSLKKSLIVEQFQELSIAWPVNEVEFLFTLRETFQ